MNPYFYVVVPTHIPDLTGPKLAAQVAHAQSKAVEFIFTSSNVYMKNLYDAWSAKCGFGTVIVLEWNGDFDSFRDRAQSSFSSSVSDDQSGYHFVHDPSYPVRNVFGEVFTIPMDTCAGILVDKDEKNSLTDFLKTLPLYRS